MGEEEEPIDSYKALSIQHLRIMVHSILGVQQARSQSLASIKRSSIDKSKKEYSFKKTELMQKANNMTYSYTEFEQECIKMMKEVDFRKKETFRQKATNSSVDSDDLSQMHSIRTQKRAVAVEIADTYNEDSIKPLLLD